MLHATEILGAETYDSAGNFVGRVKEMFIEPADQPNRVARLLLGRGPYRPIVARYDHNASGAPGRVNLPTHEHAPATSSTPMKPGWLSKKTCSINRSSTPMAEKWSALTILTFLSSAPMATSRC